MCDVGIFGEGNNVAEQRNSTQHSLGEAAGGGRSPGALPQLGPSFAGS